MIFKSNSANHNFHGFFPVSHFLVSHYVSLSIFRSEISYENFGMRKGRIPHIVVSCCVDKRILKLFCVFFGLCVTQYTCECAMSTSRHRAYIPYSSSLFAGSVFPHFGYYCANGLCYSRANETSYPSGPSECHFYYSAFSRRAGTSYRHTY